MNVSFSGCGFLGLYHMGVVSCLKTFAPKVFLNKVSGTSAGAIAAVTALTVMTEVDVRIGEMASDILQVCIEARKSLLGPFSPSFDPNKFIYESLHKILPDDVHLKVSGRLHVSLTKVYDGTNMLVTEFASKDEVINVVLASCWIPVFSGLFPPRYRGIRVIDGGYSDNLPILDEHTITVSPFCGSADICPQDEFLNDALIICVANFDFGLTIENLGRMASVLIAPNAEVLSGFCKQGFDDALRFLQQRDLLACTRCLAVESSYEIEEDPSGCLSDCVEYDPNCADCVSHREEATKEGNVHKSVRDVFTDAIEKMDSNYSQWVNSNSVLKFVVVLPARVCYKTTKVILLLLYFLTANKTVEDFIMTLMNPIFTYLLGDGYATRPNSHLARYTCELNITQYGEDSMFDQTEYSAQERRESVKEILNLGIVTHMEGQELDLPESQESAIRFQNSNLSAAFSSTSRLHSRRVSLAPSISRRASMIPPGSFTRRASMFPSALSSSALSTMGSRINSIDGLSNFVEDIPSTELPRRASLFPSSLSSSAISRMGSKKNSIDGLDNFVEEIPSTFGNIMEVTDNKEAVMSFYYKDSSSQVKLMEIFDITETDPAVLLNDVTGNDFALDTSALSSSLETARKQAGAFSRRGSLLPSK